MPRLSYGPPARVHGVTSLMAVADVEADYAPTDQLVRTGTYVAAAVMVAGAVFGSRTLRGLGAGGALALILVRAAARRR